MIQQMDDNTAAVQGRWRRFYEKLRVDIIEAQCALESGRVLRASELIDEILRDARRCGASIETNITQRIRQEGVS